MRHGWINYLPFFIRRRLEDRIELQRALANTGWLFFDRILRILLSIFIGSWVARYLGPEEFGILSYAVAYVTLFSAFANLGLDSIVIRDIVKDPASSDEILGSAFMLKLSGGILALALTIGIISFLRPVDSITFWTVGIIAAGIIFQAFDVIDFWFQSQVLSKYTVYAKNAALLLSSMIKIILILSGASLIAFVWVTLFEIVVGAGGMVVAYNQYGHGMKQWRNSLRKARELLSDSWPLFVSGIFITAYMRIDQIMLGEMLGNDAVGIYSVAVIVSEAWHFIPIIIVSSLFPSIIKMKTKDDYLYSLRLQQLHDLLFIIAVVVALTVTLTSDYIIRYLFSDRFLSARVVLNIHVWANLFVFHGAIRGHFFVIENKQHIGLWFRGTGALINIVLNLFLIPSYGVKGAAWATLLSYSLPVYLIALFHPLVRLNIIMCLKSYVLPIRILIYKKELYK